MTWSPSERWAGLYCLGIVLLIVFRPVHSWNESVSLLGSHTIADPLFLSGDWSTGGSPFATTKATFNLLVAPFWWLIGDGLIIAMTGRVVASVLVLRGLFEVTRHMKVAPWLVCLGFSLWLLGDKQSLAAGEWIFGGFEPKIFSYACLLFALSFAIRGRLATAGALSGLASAFHILVGTYGMLALGAATAFDFRRHGHKRVVRFALSALPFSIVALVLSAKYLQGGETSDAREQIDWIMVHFRNPHHLDPRYFLGIWEIAYGVLMVAVVAYCLWRHAPRDAARVVLPFLMVLCGIFVGGVLASAVGWDLPLRFYPFRVADTLLPLFFWLTVALWFGHVLTDLRVPEKRRKPGGWIVLAGLSLLIFLEVPDVSKRLVRNVTKTGSSWSQVWRGERTTKQEVLDWVRLNTPRSVNFLVPVCLDEFWLEAERPALVLHKLAPSNHRAIEWFERLKAANGGHEIQAVGFGICREIDSNYRKLSEEALSEVAGRYSLTHYLVDRRRPELDDRMVFSNEEWWVYEIGSTPNAVAVEVGARNLAVF